MDRHRTFGARLKTLALIVTLALHATGLWDRLPEHTQSDLSAATSTAQGAAAQTAVADSAPVAALPIRAGTTPLRLTAAGAIAIDANTSTVLYAQDPEARRPIASVSKLITCLVVLSRHSVEDKVTVAKLPTYQTEDELMGLVPGETYRLGDLVTAALVQSANDAADALALYDAGSTPKFAARMNAKMSEWGIAGTRFSSPAGLQDKDNYATAASLAKIAQLAITNPTITDIVKLTTATVSSTSGRTFNLTSTNKLLATGQFYGIKTGYTPAAGECFVGLTRIHGHEVITVVLGAESRFGASQELANWIGQNWQWL
jgi:D-alanyl-D-alanine carboxypeptidase (penicillin-binding protein 5/6)